MISTVWYWHRRGKRSKEQQSDSRNKTIMQQVHSNLLWYRVHCASLGTPRQLQSDIGLRGNLVWKAVFSPAQLWTNRDPRVFEDLTMKRKASAYWKKIQENVFMTFEVGNVFKNKMPKAGAKMRNLIHLTRLKLQIFIYQNTSERSNLQTWKRCFIFFTAKKDK